MQGIVFKRGDQKRICDITGFSSAVVSQALNHTTDYQKGTAIKEAAASLGYDLNLKVKRIVVEFETEK